MLAQRRHRRKHGQLAVGVQLVFERDHVERPPSPLLPIQAQLDLEHPEFEHPTIGGVHRVDSIDDLAGAGFGRPRI
jgi:hypothetical protein